MVGEIRGRINLNLCIRRRAVVGEQKIDYLVVTFVEKEPYDHGNLRNWDLNLAIFSQKDPKAIEYSSKNSNIGLKI